MSQNILITGALGHIGSKFIHGIRPGDFGRVVLIDNLSTQRYCSLFGLPDHVPFRFVECDIMDDAVETHFQGVDVVLHLAAITNAAESFEMADRVEHVNFEGTKRIAALCGKYGSKMIFLSTTSVYGTQKDLVDEDCPKEELQPQSPYAVSKLKSEDFLKGLGNQGGLRFVSLRFGTIFGYSIGMRFHTAVNKFTWQACMGMPITVWRTALDQRRPYLDLGDAMRALRLVLEKDAFDNRTYNVLTANATVGEIVDIIRSHIPDVSVKLVDERIMNQLSYEVSSEKFKRLGFAAEGSLQQAIGETIHLLKNARR